MYRVKLNAQKRMYSKDFKKRLHAFYAQYLISVLIVVT